MPDEITRTLIKSLHQGTIVQIEGRDDKSNRIIFLGNILYVSSKFIRMKFPNDKNVIKYLERKPLFTVRFRKGGFLCQFTSSPNTLNGFPYFVMQMDIPEKVTSISLRKSERLETSIPCNIRFFQLNGIKKNPIIKAVINNLSINGMRIVIYHKFLNKFILVKDVVLPDGSILKPFDVKTKNLVKKDKINLLSTQYIYISDADRESIKFFISKNLQPEF